MLCLSLVNFHICREVGNEQRNRLKYIWLLFFAWKIDYCILSHLHLSQRKISLRQNPKMIPIFIALIYSLLNAQDNEYAEFYWHSEIALHWRTGFGRDYPRWAWPNQVTLIFNKKNEISWSQRHKGWETFESNVAGCQDATERQCWEIQRQP